MSFSNRLLNAALASHRGGNLSDAEQKYRIILPRDHRNADCLHLLGVLCYQLNRYEEAVLLLRRAIRFNGSQSEYHCHLGRVFHAQENHQEAVKCYARSLDLNPHSAETLHCLGLVFTALHRYDEAQSYYERALHFWTDNPTLYTELGEVARFV
jgi:tetratricopeptide (TPR) repeat protein